MTDDKLERMLQSVIQSQQTLTESQQDLTEAQRETDRQIKETEQLFRDTGRELREQAERTNRELNEQAERTNRELNEQAERTNHELNERAERTDRRLAEQAERTDRILREQTERTDQEIKQLGKQIGGLGNKFGGFTEGLALPSMTRILQQRFGAETVAARVKVRRGAEKLEIDVLAYTNGELNTAYVVEVKSRLRERDINQVLNILERFPEFFPEHADKRVFGIIATVDIPEGDQKRVLEKGLYLASIEDDLFKMDTPPGFKPRPFGPRRMRKAA